MRSLRIQEPGRYQLLDVAMPEPKVGELLLAPVAVGLCATDLELMDGSMVYLRTGQSRLPLTPGHEWVASVAGLGEDVDGFRVGDLVVGECSIGCGLCAVCRGGDYHRCAERRETGIMNLDGALADRMIFPARAAHLVPHGVGPLDAALVEPLAIAYRAVQRSGVQSGATVLVVGAGTIGLLIAKVLRADRDMTVHILEANAHRAKRAEDFGIPECGPGQVYSHVIEASGTPAGISAAHSRLAPGGRLVLVGLTGMAEVPLRVDEIVVKDQEFVGSLGSPAVWPDVLALLAGSSLNPGKLVTHQFPLSDVEAAIAFATDRRETTGKIIIWPGEVPLA